MTDTTAADWEARLRAITRTLPPSQQRTAAEYVHDLKRLDTEPDTARPYIVALPGGADLKVLAAMADTIGTETARRRWLVALTDHIVAVVDAAAEEAQRRYDRSHPHDAIDTLAHIEGFAKGAAFVQGAVSQLLITANDKPGSGVDPGGLSLSEARAIRAASNCGGSGDE